jgi:hypothetical protein
MRKKAGAWALFLFCLLLLSFSATPYSGVANSALIAVRVALIIVLSVLVVRESWRNRHASPGAGDKLLERWRNWSHGE